MKQNGIFFFALILCVTAGRLFADDSLPLGEHYPPTTDFSANWITVDSLPDPVLPNLWIAFRRSFDLESVPTEALCRIACDSKYWLYVNGKMIVFEGGLKRGPTPNDTYYDVVDLSSSLQKGRNTIAVLLWFWGKQGFSHVNSGKPGLLFDASTNGENGLRLCSDSNWKAALYSAIPEGITAPNVTERSSKHPPVSFDTTGVQTDWREKTAGAYELVTQGEQPNCRLPEWNIRFDARYDFDGDWKAVDFNDTTWKSAVELGVPDKTPVAPWGRLYKRLVPLFKDYGYSDYLNNQEIPTVSDGTPIECRLPYNCHVTPYLKIEARAGQTIYMQTDDYKGGGENNVRSEYVTKDGVQEFETLGWMNGHTMIYTIPKGIKIISLKYRQTGYNSEFSGGFRCDDEFYNNFWKKAVRTLYVTMRDTYCDCPDRERSQWWGDAVNELGEAFYAMDRRADLIPKKGFYEIARFQRPDNVMYSPVPDGNWSTELPAQILAVIGTKGLGTYSFFSGDATTAQDIYPAIRKYLSIWQFDEDGLVIVRNGDWSWGDWGEDIDLRPLMNCWFALALKQAIELAGQLNFPEDVERYQTQLTSLEKNFNRVFWTGKDYRDPNYTGHSDDRTNAMAVIAGFAEADKYPLLREHFRQEKHASPYMEKYVLEALCMMGYADDALARLKERFFKMISHPFYTTLWEGWGIGAEGYGGGTTNHAWSGGGLTCLAQYIVGLQPTRPAFREFRLAPQLGCLNDVELKSETIYGSIEIKYRRQPESFMVEIIVPEGTEGIFGVPPEYSVEGFESVSYDTESDIYAIRDYSFIPLKTGLNKFQFKKAN